MKITSFSPLIMTKDAEDVGRLFEELGFTKRHEKKDIPDDPGSGFRMKDEEGHGISIAQVESVPQDLTLVQLNVDDFEEACRLFEAHGFRNMQGEGGVIDTGSSKTAVLVAPSGLMINVVYHVKNKE